MMSLLLQADYVAAAAAYYAIIFDMSLSRCF